MAERAVTERAVALGTGLAVAGAVHCALNSALLRRPVTTPNTRRVPVLIPARDEQHRLAACLRSLAGQDAVAEVVVLDDCSRDRTAALAAGFGARVVAGSTPPPGWLGKPWACRQLLEAVEDDVVVFVDADVRLRPGAVASAVALLETSGLDIVCPFPSQLAGTPAERLVQPLLTWSWLTTLPLRLAERSRRPSLSAACGQFVVARRAAVESAGGFAAVRGEVLDDLALVRAIKAAGGRGGVVDGSQLAECRMYEGRDQLRDGYAKSLWTAFGSPARAAGVLAVLWLSYVLPAAAMLRGSRLGALGYLAGVASRAIAGRASRVRVWPDAFAHPVSIVALTALTGESVRRRRSGTLSWRGRAL